jgi:hypothetical protein
MAQDVTDPTGGHLFRRFMLRNDGSVTASPPPQRGARRRTPSLDGLGLLERAKVGSGSSTHGRFGWKARYRTLDEMVAAALVNELGVSSPVFPHDATRSRTGARIEIIP